MPNPNLQKPCPFDRRKSRYGAALITATVTALLLAAMLVGVAWLGWHSLNKQLCKRNYTPAAYQDMQLDCTSYGIPPAQ